jgi:circadian clock protein KaiC
MAGRNESESLMSTGIAGLDDVLGGGLQRHRLYLLEGGPGSGKTTVALQFLLAGVPRGESLLYVTLSETARELQAVALSHGWTLDGLAILELMPGEEALDADELSTMFHPSEFELAATTQRILEKVDHLKPTCVVIDSLSELRLLSGNALRYRRQILALKQYFTARQCTVLLLDDLTDADRDLQMHSVVHAVILLELLNPEYGADRRRLRVRKYRGMAFRSGYHDYGIRTGGIDVYPRLVAAEHRSVTPRSKLASGIAEFDALLGGGLERGTSTLLVGPAGTGKSTLASQFAAAAAARGQKAAMFVFDESTTTLLARAAELNIDLTGGIEAGLISVKQINPAELSPGEFTHAIRSVVEEDDTAVVVIDSLNGYLNAMPAERFLTIQLHELLSYLGERNVVTILVSAHQGLMGQMHSTVDASYLADTIVLLRYFEDRGEVRQAISVMKKRGSQHERTIRELVFANGRIRIGPPLTEFRGVLTGVPVFEGRPGRAADKPSS